MAPNTRFLRFTATEDRIACIVIEYPFQRGASRICGKPPPGRTSENDSRRPISPCAFAPMHDTVAVCPVSYGIQMHGRRIGTGDANHTIPHGVLPRGRWLRGRLGVSTCGRSGGHSCGKSAPTEYPALNRISYRLLGGIPSRCRRDFSTSSASLPVALLNALPVALLQ